MTWINDLEALLGDIQSGAGQKASDFFTSPVGQPVGAALTSDAADAAFRFMDVPLSFMKEQVGQGFGVANELLTRLPGDLGNESLAAEFNAAGGFGVPGAGRAEWERAISGVPGLIKIPLELGLDPVNWTGVGAARRGATALGQIGRTGEAGVFRTLDTVYNKAPMAIASPVLSRTGKAVRAGITKVAPNALELEPKSALRRRMTDIANARARQLEARDTPAWNPQRYLPAVPWVGPGKSLAPIEEYDIPPFFANDFDAGVPRAVKARAWESWQRLRMSHPDIPGITAPGTTSAQPGQATFMQGQRPGEGGGLIGRLRNAANGPLGIVPQRSGTTMFATPADLGGLNEQDLRDMATIGAAVMVDFDNQVSNKMFAAIRRTGPGFGAVKKEIIRQFGPGIEPVLPAMYDDFRNILAEQGISLGEAGARFLTNWGFPEGTISTKRLDAIQRRLEKTGRGSLTPEKAFLEIMKGMSKKSPEAIETAAAMGAGWMSIADNLPEVNPWQGGFAIPGISAATKRAEIPDAFTNYLDETARYSGQFVSNREAYNTYMTQLFGQMTDEELDLLRRMSVEILYDDMMNAATEVSGSVAGATRLYKEGPPRPGTRTEFEQYGDEKYTKIGVYPEKSSDIGNRPEFAAETTPPEGGWRHGKPGMREANRQLYERLSGKSALKSWTDARVSEEIRKLGEEPFTYNPRGGPLASVQRIIDAHAAGKDITVGESVASEWYQDAVDEIMDIVGPGRYEDAMMLMELMAVTSAGTEVGLNAKNALRAFAEWKLGSDDYIRNRMGLTPEEVDAILNKPARWTGNAPSGDILGDELFMNAMAKSQKRNAGKIFEEYIRRRQAMDEGWHPMQGGPKTNNYAGSFVIKLWMDTIARSVPDEQLRNRVLSALDEAATIYTVDRHDSRLDNLATAVTPMSAISRREQRILAARQIPGVRPEDIQAAAWYWSKDKQGFSRVDRSDDMAAALRQAWNERKDPGLDATIRERLREEFPDITEDELRERADDLMRQEVVYSYLQEALGGSERVQSILGRNPVAGIVNMGDDHLGLFKRAMQGLPPPEVPLSRAITRLVSDVENILRGVREGTSQGATLRYSGGQFVPDDATSGFAVALTSAGTTVDTARRKTSSREIERLLARYADTLDDPTVAEHIRFGVFPMDDGASFDLGIVVPDEQTAIDLGRLYNQQSIYNLGTGELISTGGSGKPVVTNPDELREAIEAVFGRTQRTRPSPREVIARGVTIDEMDSMNPVSILNRKVVQPIMRMYQEQSVASVEPPRPTPGPRQGVMVQQPDPTSPFDFKGIYQDPMLSTQENMILNEVIDGETVGQILDREYDAASETIAQLDEAGIMWGPDTPLEDRLKMLDAYPELKKEVKRYADAGIDIRYADPHTVEMRVLERAEAKRAGIDIERQTWADLIRAAWGEQALFSPKYHMGNIQGAWLQNAFGGHFRSTTPAELIAAYKLTRGGLDKTTAKEAMNALYVGRVAQKWGYDELPKYLFRGSVRDMVSSSRMSGSAMGEIAGRVTGSRRVGKMVGRPFEANADMGQAIEISMRGAIWGDVVDREMTNAMEMLESEIMVMAQRQGLDDFEFSILDNINPVPGGPSPARLREHLRSMGFGDGYAERAGRNFAEARNKAERIAKAEIDKRQFSYERTNLDEFVGKFIPFHYWYSRALRYYGEELLRHPFVALNYMRANQGIEAAQDDPGLSARQKGFLRLMGTPLGFSLLMNPDALFGVVKVFGIDNSIEPNGETSAGGVVRWLKERGMGLYPWIDGMFNLMGMYGDTFEPDMLGIRHKTLIGAAVNFVRSQLGFDPMNAPYQTAMGQARWSVSSFVSQFTPDWLSQPVLPKAAGNTADATIDTIIESRVIANNPGLTNQQLLDIMTDTESPQYQEAFRQAAAAGLIQQLLNFTLPQSYRMREDTRDVRNAQISTIYEAAERAGVSPTEFAPKEGDLAFAEEYRRQTGKDWQPGDYEDAKAESDLSRATPEHKPFVVQENEYYSLGTDSQRRIFKLYEDIRTGKNPRTARLDPGNRKMLADAWADQQGYTPIIADLYRQRQAYEATHPEFAGFKFWQDQMYELKTQLGGSLDEYRRVASQQNPNAARYFQSVISEINAQFPYDAEKRKEELDRRTTNAEAYLTINGLPQMRFDAAPTPGFPMGDPTLASAGIPAPNQYNPDYGWISATRQLPGQFGTTV